MRDNDGIVWMSDVMDEVVANIERWQAEAAAWEQNPERWDFDEPLTWDKIVEREPRLASLEASAARAGRANRDSYAAWYREIKPQIEQLVGYRAEPGQPIPLTSSEVYDVVYRHLLRLYDYGVAA